VLATATAVSARQFPPLWGDKSVAFRSTALGLSSLGD